MSVLLGRERDLVLRYVRTVHTHPDEDDDEIVPLLIGDGVSELDARLLQAFVPEALARVEMAQHGVSFTRSVGVKSATANWVWIPLASVPIYQAALSVARDAFKMGTLSRERYELVSHRSATYNVASKALSSRSIAEQRCLQVLVFMDSGGGSGYSAEEISLGKAVG